MGEKGGERGRVIVVISDGTMNLLKPLDHSWVVKNSFGLDRFDPGTFC